MVQSSWLGTWRKDFGLIHHSMSDGEQAQLQRWGLLTAQGRRIFAVASDRLAFDVVYSSYLMERAALDA